MDDRRRNDTSEDYPPHSRLFIVCSKQLEEKDFREAFSKFGHIEDIRMPRDRNTNEYKGVAYIKFSKTSEAAKALNESNYKIIKEGTRCIKVMVAASKSEIADDDEDKYRRLFIKVDKSETQQDISQHFEQFGDVDSVLIQTDKDTRESKGFAYVKFRSFLSAAKAFEEADRKYRPIFAKPKGKVQPMSRFENNINSVLHESSGALGVASMLPPVSHGFTRLQVICTPYLNQSLLYRLFDIVPGLESVKYWTDMVQDCGKALVVYANPSSAAHALKKLDNLEYPPGQRMFLKPDWHGGNNYNSNDVSGLVNNLKKAMNSGSTPDLVQLVETIAQASSLIKKATSSHRRPGDDDLNYCSQPLPPIQPLADINATCAKRCFIVCSGQPPSAAVLRDVFCRFGDLIDVSTLPGKTVGYARYASANAATEAIRLLHGAEVCGVRLKVLEAEERGGRGGGGRDDDVAAKRMRVD